MLCKKCTKKLHQTNSIIAFQCIRPFHAFSMPLGRIIGRRAGPCFCSFSVDLCYPPIPTSQPRSRLLPAWAFPAISVIKACVRRASSAGPPASSDSEISSRLSSCLTFRWTLVKRSISNCNYAASRHSKVMVLKRAEAPTNKFLVATNCSLCVDMSVRLSVCLLAF